ncbi:aldehyde dehydrogenase family protein [archaeon]|nr:MAG: aldehyde dehydrogenase family protein [archaeon]
MLTQVRRFMLRRIPRRQSSSVPAATIKLRPIYGAYIDGEEVVNCDANSDKYTLRSPATRQALCDVVNTSKEDTNRAIEVANQVFEAGVWSKSDVRYRAKILTDIANELRASLPRFHQLETLQTGRPIREMKAQVLLCALHTIHQVSYTIHYTPYTILHAPYTIHALFIPYLLCSWVVCRSGSSTMLLRSAQLRAACPPSWVLTLIMWRG